MPVTKSTIHPSLKEILRAHKTCEIVLEHIRPFIQLTLVTQHIYVGFGRITCPLSPMLQQTFLWLCMDVGFLWVTCRVFIISWSGYRFSHLTQFERCGLDCCLYQPNHLQTWMSRWFLCLGFLERSNHSWPYKQEKSCPKCDRCHKARHAIDKQHTIDNHPPQTTNIAHTAPTTLCDSLTLASTPQTLQESLFISSNGKIF